MGSNVSAAVSYYSIKNLYGKNVYSEKSVGWPRSKGYDLRFSEVFKVIIIKLYT